MAAAMKLLGAIIAGGQARRFGSDKAAALLQGRPLVEHVASAMREQTDHVVVCGRSWQGYETVPDSPRPGLGPLGGLCGALHYASAHEFDAVLAAGCDVLPIPVSLAVQLDPGPAVIADQRLLGLWPASLAETLEQHLLESVDRSMRGWISRCGAREVTLHTLFHNINTAADLDRLARS